MRVKIKIIKWKIIIIVSLILWAINHFAIPAGTLINKSISSDGKYILETYQKPRSIFAFNFGHLAPREYFVVLRKSNGWIIMKPGYWIDSIWDDLEFDELEGTGGADWNMKERRVWFT